MKHIVISILFIVCFQSSFATDFYVSTSGNDASGNGSQASPWRTLKVASTKVPANQGHTIRVSAGTFVESQFTLPPGVSILGAGIGQTIIKANPSLYYNPATPGFGTDKFLINLSSSAPTNGNQTIKGFTVDGDGKKLHGAIYVRYRNNVVLDAIKVQNTNFTGIWLWDMKDSRMTNVQFRDCAWGSSGWSAAALLLANLERVEIDHIDVNEGFGEGVKSLGANGTAMGKLHYLKFHDNRISVTPTGQWNGGAAPNIAVEFWNIEMLGCEMYNNYIDNTISLVNDQAQFTTPKGVTTIHLYNNVFDLETRANGGGYALEASLHDIEIDHNYFLRGSNGVVNWSTHGIKMANWKIHHNVFYYIAGGFPAAILRAKKDGFHNVKFYNNTIELAGARTTNVVTMMDGVSNNVEIKNNLIINSNTAYNYYPNKLVYIEKGTMNNLQVSNNLFYNIPAGTVPGTYTNNLTVDPKINKTGARPTAYYLPTAGSPLVDAGVNVGFPFSGKAPDIGAYESTGSTISITGVSITPSSLTLPVVGTNQLSKTISPANATNQTVSWNSSNTNVATVSNAGLVTAVAAGTATITVTTAEGGKTSSSIITVTAPIPLAVTGVSITQPTVTLAQNGTTQLSKIISPTNATNQNVNWSSSNASCVTVSNAGVVTGIAPGSATITVTTVDGNKAAASVITVGTSQLATFELDDAALGTGTNQFNYAGTGWVHGTNSKDPYLKNTVSYSNVSNNAVTLSFTGHKVELYTAKASHHGIAAISIDNGPETFIDLYSATRQSFISVYNSILTEAKHTIKIRVTGTKNAASTGANVVIDYIKVYSNSATITVPVAGVAVSPLSVPLNVGATYQLVATVSPATASNKNINWSSSNTSVATVSTTGLVTALTTGSATITATTVDGGKTSSTVVTSPAPTPVPVTAVSVTPATLPLSVGSTYQFASSVSPANATNKNVNWSSSNSSIVMVSPAGQITTVASGSATITATTLDGGKVSSSVITVTVPVTSVSLVPSNVPLLIGSTYQMVATISPANATNKNITWSSTNTNIATVSTSGLVKAVAVGNATITAKTVDGNKTATSSITIDSQQNFVDLDDATKGSGINQFKYTGSAWTNAINTSDSYFNKTCSHSNVSGNYVTLSFSGNKVELYSSKASHHGIAAVSIDNGPEILVDLYSPTRQDFFMLFSSGTLTEGNHSIKIRVTGTKTAASSGTYVVVDYLKVYSESVLPETTVVTSPTASSSLLAAGEEAELTGQVQLFPNPVRSGDILHVMLPFASGVVSIIDATGFAHYTAQVTTAALEIPTSGLPTGMYFLQHISAQGQVQLKILVD